MPRWPAISAASAGWVVPENSIIFFLVTISTGSPLALPLRLRSRTPAGPGLPPGRRVGVLPLAVTLHHALLGALDGERAAGNGLGDRRSRPRDRALPHSDRRHEHRIRPDAHVVVDDGAMLAVSVVVDGHRPRTDVRALADPGVAHVRQVWDLRSRAHLRCLDLDEAAGLGSLLQHGPWTDVSVGADDGPPTDPRPPNHGELDGGPVIDTRVADPRGRPDLGALADPAVSLEERQGVQDRVRPDLDVHVDERRLRVKDGDPFGHVPSVDPFAHHPVQGDHGLPRVHPGPTPEVTLHR